MMGEIKDSAEWRKKLYQLFLADEIDCPTKEIPTVKPEVNANKVDHILILILSFCLLSALIISLGIYIFFSYSKR